MRIFVLVCCGLLAFAVGFEVLTLHLETATVADFLKAQPPAALLGWLLIGLVPLLLIGAALWEGERLIRQRRATEVLETRLRGLQQNVKEMSDAQRDVDGGAAYLNRSDPEDAITALQGRLFDAERAAHLQQSRNDASDLMTRVENTRQQQQALRERLGDIVQKRKTLEPHFVELRKSQDDLERIVKEVEGEDLQNKLQKLTESSDRIHAQCTDAERAMTSLQELRGKLDAVGARLNPLEDEKTGVRSVIKELYDLRDRLSANIDSLDRGDGHTLAERVSTLADAEREMKRRVLDLTAQFAKLDTIYEEMSGLFAKLGREINAQLPGQVVPGQVASSGMPAKVD
jgi:chromosome segregation ATPase